MMVEGNKKNVLQIWRQGKSLNVIHNLTRATCEWDADEHSGLEDDFADDSR